MKLIYSLPFLLFVAVIRPHPLIFTDTIQFSICLNSCNKHINEVLSYKNHYAKDGSTLKC